MGSLGIQRFENDVLGQFPQLKTYNHGLLCFAVDESVSRESVVDALEGAARRIMAQVPWLADQVVNEGKGPDTSGVFTLAPWPSDAPPNTLVRVRDCSDICPSYTEILAANGPITMFDGQVLCPFPAFPLSYDEAIVGPAPPIMMQANFIKGGLLLNFANQHNMVDASGLFVFIMLLAIEMRGEQIPEKVLQAANCDRSNLVPLLAPGEQIKDYSHLYRPVPPPGALPPAPPKPMAPARWAYFRFSKQSIAKIKALASDPAELNAEVPFISTNDALCAFYWKRLSTVRVARGVDASASSKFSRAIDIRAAAGVPMGYMGQMVYQAATRLPLQDVVNLPLAALAVRIRRDLNEANTLESVRSYATFLAGVPDKSKLLYGGVFNPATDVGTSSMSQANVVLDFGILGVPTLARRPNLPPVPCCMYFYPPEGDSGYFPVLACLTEGEMEAICADPEWSAATTYIG